MDALAESRRIFNKEFGANIELAFFGIGTSMRKRVDVGKWPSMVFKQLEYIISEDEVRNGGHRNLMRKLMCNISDELNAWLFTYQQCLWLTILRDAVSASKCIRDGDKKLAKLLSKYATLKDKSSKKAKKSKLSELRDDLKSEWLAYQEAVRKQTVVLACLEEKFSNSTTLGMKAKRLVYRLIGKTMKLRKHLNRCGSEYHIESESSSSEDETHELASSTELVPKSKSEVTKLTKVPRGLVKKITKPGIFKIQPWPLGDAEGPGIKPTQPVNYDMFLVSAWVNLKLDTRTISVESLTRRAHTRPCSSSLTFHSSNSNEAGEKVTPLDQDASKKHLAKSSPSSLAEMKDVYVRVVEKFKATDKLELTLKIEAEDRVIHILSRQIVKQKLPADECGFAYGWTKTRLGLKKYGFYPVSHVTLDGQEKK